MITVPVPLIDIGWYLAAAFVLLCVVLLAPLVVRQARHQRAEDAAVDRWRDRDARG